MRVTEFASYAFAATLLAFGVYVVIAALIPYKEVTRQISNEVLQRVLVEMPLRFLARLVSKAVDFFMSH